MSMEPTTLAGVARSGRHLGNRVGQALWVGVVLCAFGAGAVWGDTKSATDGRTPPGMAAGSPAGSYLLSDFESVDLFSGNLNFALPLHRIAGRGDAGYTITLGIKRHWTVRKLLDPINPELFTLSVHPNLWDTGDGPDDVGYSAGLLVARQVAQVAGPCQHVGEAGVYPGRFQESMTRLSFMSPDGTEHQLESKDPLGPLGPSKTCWAEGLGPVGGYPTRDRFYSTDGSQMAFRPDTPIQDLLLGLGPPWYGSANSVLPTGWLMFGDGTAYRIEKGRVAKIRDRNGNLVEFTFDATPLDPTASPFGITDSLGRQTTVRPLSDEPVRTGEAITFGGFGGAPRVVRVQRTNLANALAPAQELSTYGQLFPMVGPLFPDTVFNPLVASAVVLPDGREYAFKYTSYGKLARVELPTGGAIEYEYAPIQFDMATTFLAQPITTRRLYSGADALVQETTYRSEVGPQSTTVTVVTADGEGDVLSQTRHQFHGRRDGIADPVWGGYAIQGREFQTQVLDGGVLRTEDRTWQDRLGGAVVTEERTTLDDGQVARKAYDYDELNNRISRTDYGFDGSPLRRTCARFVKGSEYTQMPVHLVRLPLREAVYEPGGGDVECTAPGATMTTYAYDDEPLADRPGITGHEDAFGTGYAARGNITAVSNWLSTGGEIVTRRRYDIAGNVVASQDGRGYWTDFSHDDLWRGPGAPAGTTYAYPTSVTNPLSHTSRTRYDFATGLLVEQQDANDVSTELSYDDPLDRPTQAIQASNVEGARTRTSYQYDDAARRITTTSDLNNFGDGVLRSVSLYDGLGRLTETQQHEGDGYITVRRQHDGLGRVSAVSSPYRPGSEPEEWTTTTYDRLSRPKRIATPDGASTVTDYLGNKTTVTDPAGKVRTSVADALGRTVRVVEASSADEPCGSDRATCYEYDGLDNLKTVRQGTQTREFRYDSLARLRTAQNPESGTVTYDYDANGNLTVRTDARSVVTSFAYDPLNRVTGQSYSGGTASAEAVVYEYDQSGGYPLGRLSRVFTGSFETSYDEYDALGRVRAHQQATHGRAYKTYASFNRAGLPTSDTYPSGRVVETSYDAAGRIQGVTGTGPGGTGAVFMQPGTVAYASHGGMSRAALGNGLWQHMTYNSRQQPTEIGLGSSPNDSSALGIGYGYGGTGNNGNVLEQEVRLGGHLLEQGYTYDSHNRLEWMAESRDGTGIWGQTYRYDRFGNRWLDPGSFIPSPSLTPTSAAAFDVSNNRLVGAGTEYDAAGNLTQDATGRTLVYDAENRLVRFSAGGVNVEYGYDGEGRRVIKHERGGHTWVYAYDARGRLLTEHSDEDELRPAKDFIYAGLRLVAEAKSALGEPGPGPNRCLPRPIAPLGGALFETTAEFQWNQVFGVTTYRLTLRTPQGERLTFDVTASEACRENRCRRTPAQLGRRLIGRAHWWDIEALGSGSPSCGETKFYVNQTMAPGSNACTQGQCSDVCTPNSPCDGACTLPAGWPTDCGGYHWGEGGPACNEDYTCQSCSARGGTCAEACAVGEEISSGRTADCAFQECCGPANHAHTCSDFAGLREWQCADSGGACPSGMEAVAPTTDCSMCCVGTTLACVHQGGELCSQEPQCPSGYRPLTPTALCPSCCDQYPADSCLWAKHADFCSNDSNCPLNYDNLGSTSDCPGACCKESTQLPDRWRCENDGSLSCRDVCLPLAPCDAPCREEHGFPATCSWALANGGACSSSTTCQTCSAITTSTGTCAPSCPSGTHSAGRTPDCDFQHCCAPDGGGCQSTGCPAGSCGQQTDNCGNTIACGDCPPVCGDGVCTPYLEDCGTCLGDCPCWMENTVCNASGSPGQCVSKCDSPATHDHTGSCGSADECGHFFGRDTDCGCPGAALIWDTCSQEVCDTCTQWVPEECSEPVWVCDTCEECHWEFTENNYMQVWVCTSYECNCRWETRSFQCGGHQESYPCNCRQEDYACNPHPC